jgi:uncharacterized Zn finger protein
VTPPRRERAPSRTRRTFGHTWWGKAWIEALEHRARLDPNRLPRGRTYARTGRVAELKVGPGEVRAPVHGSRVVPYLVQVRVRMFDPAEWDRLLDAIAAKAAHTAALLDGELPPEVVGDAAAVDVELLPGPGEIGPRCSCPDWADPCKHSAAVTYLVADVLDADPFALLLLRGRTRDEILAALRQRRSARAGDGLGPDRAAPKMGRPVDPGIEARVAWYQPRPPGAGPLPVPAGRSGRSPFPPVPVAGTGFPPRAAGGGTGRSPFPPVPLPPRHAGRPAALAVDPPLRSGLRAQDLSDLAADAAERALALCVGDGDGGLTLDPELDLIRRAASCLARPQRRGLDDLAAAAGRNAAEVGRLAQAWLIGGADAVEVLVDAWSPPSESMTEGRAALLGLGPTRVWRNRLTVGSAGIQLRLSRAGSWYRFEPAGTSWELIDGPAADPADLLG